MTKYISGTKILTECLCSSVRILKACDVLVEYYLINRMKKKQFITGGYGAVWKVLVDRF